MRVRHRPARQDDRPDKTISPHTLDAGVNRGVTRAAPDVQAFFGMTVRF